MILPENSIVLALNILHRDQGLSLDICSSYMSEQIDVVFKSEQIAFDLKMEDIVINSSL